ncbi:uncharacterized protein LOC103698874 [Phoenix dactylifera]|uniref:Uncharacterized protein LOC103698874 n=1 Tax=Phoenix dactylifera TaxID=42345 RepID=A0A8B7BK94_PHODC|nr:uncharacterized protein LOC103698874 [Phoenix dactylifera]
MRSASKASLIVAASMAAVEALKDQAGLCRWNYAIRSLNQQAKNNIRSFPQTRRVSSSSSSSSDIERRKGSEGADEKAKRSEEALRKVMYLSCWGPN